MVSAQWYAVLEQTHNERGWIHPADRRLSTISFPLHGNVKKPETALRCLEEMPLDHRYDWGLMKHVDRHPYIGRWQRVKWIGRSDDPTMRRRLEVVG